MSSVTAQMRSTAVSTSLSSCRCSSSSPRPCTSASAAAMRSAIEATASVTGCSRSDAYSDMMSSSKVEKPGWSATLNASAARAPRRTSSIWTEPRVDAGRGQRRAQDVVQGAGVGFARPGQREQGADEHVAADAAGAVEVEDHAVTLSRCRV